ncbi:hypothetical protein B0H11DRAFT_2258403 [Mycena galericulata]|nr:hypothetical protein B0H11DRAFT_2258403 [Mycena galericulata]
MPSRLARWTLSRAQKAAHDDLRSQPEYHPLTSLPTELLLAVLEVMDDSSLHIMVAVSKRFYYLATQSLLSRYDISLASGNVTTTSSAALRALRIAMTLCETTFKGLNVTFPDGAPVTKDIRRIEALLRRCWARPARIRKVSLNFGRNLIERPVGWTIGGVTPKLMSTICGGSPVALFVAVNGIFTCKPRSMLLWSPYTRDPYCKMQMHDDSRQWVPSIRSIRTLDVEYPICYPVNTTLLPPPSWSWTMVVVNAKDIGELFLSIQLSTAEWSVILSSITLPNLREVGIWAETITSADSTSFLNRHPVATLRYMSPAALSSPSEPLFLPTLHRLIAVSHYIIHIFRRRNPVLLFPSLIRVELWPDAQFHAALQLVSAHPLIQRLGLWMIEDFDDVSLWPVFPSVGVVELNKCLVAQAGLPALLARTFPALRRLHVNHSFPKASSPAQAQAIRKSKLDVVAQVSGLNPGVESYLIDGELVEP